MGTVPKCTCGNSGRCGYCPRIAVVATTEASLPAESAGQRAMERLARRSSPTPRR